MHELGAAAPHSIHLTPSTDSAYPTHAWHGILARLMHALTELAPQLERWQEACFSLRATSPMHERECATKCATTYTSHYVEVELGAVCEIHFSNPKLSKSHFGTTGVPYIHYGQIHTGAFRTWTATPLTYIDPVLARTARTAQCGDVIITDVSETLGAIAKPLLWLGTQRAVTSQSCLILRPHPELLDPLYLTYVLQSSSFALQKQRITVGSNIYHIYANDLHRCKLRIPELRVQRAIAQLLMLYDQLLHEPHYGLERAIVLAEQQLDTNLQRLLPRSPQAITTNSATYNSANSTRWTWYPLGKLCTTSRGRVLSKAQAAACPGDYPVYSSQISQRGEMARVNYYDWDGAYITWTTDGVNAGTVFFREGKFSLTNVCGLVALRPEWRERVNLRFLYFYLRLVAPQHVNHSMANAKLMSKSMEQIAIPIPPLEQQEEIVQLLNSLEEVLEHPQHGLRQLQELYQQQFNYYLDLLCR